MSDEGSNIDRIRKLLMAVPEEQREPLFKDMMSVLKEETLAKGEDRERQTDPERPTAGYSWRQRREFRDFVPASRKQIRKSLSSRARYSNMDAFIDRLRDKRKPSSLSNLRGSTMDLVSYMTEIDPKTGQLRLSRNGREIIVGDVQSGKSEAAEALTSAALDLGCRVVLVIAGTTDKLRNQTQRRFDTDLVDASLNLMSPTTDADLSTYREGNMQSRRFWGQLKGNVKQFLEADESNSVILTVKKHPKVLEAARRLLGYISHWGLLNGQPILVIDDESDQAGQNGMTEFYDPEERSSDATPIHKALVNIVEEFDTIYWGMTATAAGAVVLHPRDPLFPRHAHVLDSHEFYLGAYDVFIENAGMLVDPNRIDDFALPRFKDIVPFLQREASPPSSLVSAMVNHALSGALHHMCPRDPMPHGSRHACLVNMCRQIDGHVEILRLVEQAMERARVLIRQAMERSSGTGTVDKAIARFKENRRAFRGAELGFPSREELLEASLGVLNSTETKLLNSPSDDDLDYGSADFPDNIVVIGSQLVSRGITIEGLRTTYYVHEPNDIVNDSTIQNARWLGPLKGDMDLISIHLSGELIRRFRNIAWDDAMLRDTFRHCKENDIPLLDISINYTLGHRLSSKNRHMSRKSSSGNRVQIKNPWIGTDNQSKDSLNEGLSSLLEKYEPSQLISAKGANIGAIVSNVENKDASDFLRDLKVSSNERARISNLADRISTIGNKVPDSGGVNIVIRNGSGSSMGQEVPKEVRSMGLSRVKRASSDGTSVDQLISGMDQGTSVLSSDWFCDQFTPLGPTARARGWRSLKDPILIVIYVIDDHASKPLAGSGPWICLAATLPHNGPGGSVMINKHSKRGEEE